jgi:hypothetical protein
MPALKAIIGGDASGLEKELRKVGMMAEKMASTVKHSFLGLGDHLGSLLTFGAVEESARRAIEWGKSIKLMAGEAGVGVEFIQGFESAAHKLGISIDIASNSLSVLSRKIGEARMGGKEQSLFAKWKIDIDGLNNEQIFYEIADKMASLHDPALRNAMAFDLMGKSSKEMAVGLELGADGLRSLITESDKLSNQQIENLHEIDVKLEELGRKWKMLWGTIVTFAMTAAAPIGREIEVQIMTADLATSKRINMADLVKRQKSGSYKEKGKAAAQFDMLRQEAIGIVEALHRDDNKPGKTQAPAKDAESARKAQLAEAKEVARLKEHLFDLQQENDLRALSKEEQIQELYRRRAEIIAAMGKSRTEVGQLNAAIDVERIDRELRGIRPDKDKNESRLLHGSVTSLQAVGAYASPASNVMIDTSKKIEHHLAEMKHDIKRMANGGIHGGGKLGGVNYGH